MVKSLAPLHIMLVL
ncbi:hypothetical protein SAMN02744778_02137 [Pantoea sp. GL120224-02]|nr:hypothetical protein SAMN02744778_02137 [Pantoea sp. GL120224-02]